MSVRRTTAGLVLVPLLLSACGGGDDSVADPPVSSAPTSSPTESPEHESPEHFIRRWTQLEQAMENTGKVHLAFRTSAAHASPASGSLATVQGFYRDGGYVRVGWLASSRRSSEVIQVAPSDTFTVRINSAPTTYKEKEDGPTRHLQGGPSTELLTLRRTSTGWLMHDTVEQASLITYKAILVGLMAVCLVQLTGPSSAASESGATHQATCTTLFKAA